MDASNATYPALRLADSTADLPRGAVAAVRDRLEVAFGDQPPEPPHDIASDFIEPFPAWLAGGIIIGLSSIFWVGLLTVIGWVI